MNHKQRTRYAIEFELYTRVIEQKVLRRKIQKGQSVDPVLFHHYMKEKSAQESLLPKSETILLIIEKLCSHLRIKRFQHEHKPRLMTFSFYSKSGYVVFRYNKAGWISIIPNCETSYGIDFKPDTAEELIEKLIRFRIIERL
jgi:membrane-bound acyltransferase YfiQ involved in biofilm formation